MKHVHVRALPLTVLNALSPLVLVNAVVPGSGGYADAAAWLAPAASDELRANWVKEIEAELRSPKYNQLFINALGNPPQPAMLHLFNAAAAALRERNPGYAKELIDQAIRILEAGIQKGWYSEAEVQPLVSKIVATTDAAVEGKAVSGQISPERWTGYVQNRTLGMTERLDDSNPASRFTDEAAYEEHADRDGH